MARRIFNVFIDLDKLAGHEGQEVHDLLRNVALIVQPCGSITEEETCTLIGQNGFKVGNATYKSVEDE